MSDAMREPVQLTLFDNSTVISSTYSMALPLNEYRVSYILLQSFWEDDSIIEHVFHDFNAFLKCLDYTHDLHLVGYRVRFN